MNRQITPELKDQLYDPIKFMYPNEYKRQKKARKRRGIISIVIGLVILIVAPMLYGNGELSGKNAYSSGGRNNNTGLLFLAIALPLYGLYTLMTIDRTIERVERVQLLWLNPQLKALEAERKLKQKQSKVPAAIIITIVAMLILTGLFFWIKSIVDLKNQ